MTLIESSTQTREPTVFHLFRAFSPAPPSPLHRASSCLGPAPSQKQLLILSFLISFYVVNGIVFTTVFFFFRSHNFKKPYITSFNRKKALIEKEDTRNTVILTLLPKIDRYTQVNKETSAKRTAQPCGQPTAPHAGGRERSASARRPSALRPARPPCALRLPLKIHTVSELVPKY